MRTALVRSLRLPAALLAGMLLLAACGGEEGPEPEAEDEPELEEPAEGAPEEAEEAEEPVDPDAQRPALYYPGSELFLPDHEVEGQLVDYYASFDAIDDIAVWFEDNLEDPGAYTVTDDVVNGVRRWEAVRPTPAQNSDEQGIVRIEIADTTAHGDLGLIAPIADALPPDSVVIAIARETS